MAVYKIAICQLSLEIKINPVTISNPESLRDKVLHCIEVAIGEGCNFIVFPEYSFYPELMEEMYSIQSRKIVIIGGSYQTATNHNCTVVASGGQLYFYNKINLSPMERAGFSPPLVSGHKPVFVIEPYPNCTCGILTCFDYHRLGRDLVLKTNGGKPVDIVFNPSCHNRVRVAHFEAEALHNQRDDFYSVFCNVAGLSVGAGGTQTPDGYGGSAIFGIYDPATKKRLETDQVRDKTFENMILGLGSEQQMAIVEIQIPYVWHRMSSMTFTHNPITYQLLPI